MMKNPNHVAFFDTTLRDGEQSPGCSMTTQEKLTMAHALEDLGVDIIEAGFAMASEGDFAAIATITQAVRKPRIASLARAKAEDIEMAARALQFAERSRIHVFLASSDLHLEYKLKMSRQQALDQAAESVRSHARSSRTWSFRPKMRHAQIATSWSRSCAWPSKPAPPPSTCPTPWVTPRRKSTARCSAKCASAFRRSMPRASSFHPTAMTILVLAAANSLAAISAGARQVECTINGIGERAGNASLEEIAAALHVRSERYGVTTNIKLDQLYPTSEVLGQIITFKPSPNKAIVGANAFAHESGIHQHGMLANPALLRNHDAGTRGRVENEPCARQAQRARGAAASAGAAWLRALARGVAARVLPLCGAGRSQEEHLRPGLDWNFAGSDSRPEA